MKTKTNGRDLLSKALGGLSLFGMLAGFCMAAGAQSRPGAAQEAICGAVGRPHNVLPSQAQSAWAEVFPQGTAAGLAKQAQDGGFVFTGQTTAAGAGGLDLWLLKLDASGTVVWQETLGTAEDDGGAVLALPGGGFIAQAGSGTSHGFWLAKLDESGAPQWQEKVGVPPGHGEIDAVFPQEAGLLLTGTVINPLFQKTTPALVRLDDAGGVVWQWNYKSATSPGAGGDTYLFAGVTPLAKGAFAVSGTRVTAMTGDSDLFLLIVDSDGLVVWQWTYDSGENEVPVSLLKTDDEGFLYQGMVTPRVLRSGHGVEASGLLLLRLDATGGILWQKKITGASGLTGAAVANPAGGFVVSGTTASFGAGETDVWAAAFDDSGRLLWQRAYGGPGPDGGLVLPDPLGGFLLQGTSAPDDQTPADFWLAKLDDGGQIVWQCLYGGAGPEAGAAVRLAGGDLLLGGSTTDVVGAPTQAWAARLLETGGLGSGCSWIHAAALFAQDGQSQVSDAQSGVAKTDLVETLATFFIAPFSASMAGASLLPEEICPPLSGVIATAGADVTSGIEPLTVHFTGTASGGAGGYSYSWSFGDGGSSSEQNPVHEYVAAGNFGVTLTVSDSSSQTATDDHLLIHVTALAASSSGDVSSGTAPLTVHFTGSATGGASPYTYTWTFGDGATSTVQSPSHAYAAAGVFAAVLTVTDSAAHTALAPPLPITVLSPLAATALADAASGTAPLTVHFTGSATGGATPYTYAWAFGDGGTSMVQNPSHEYLAAGVFTAVLTVTDSASHTAQAPGVTISITAPLVAAAAADKTGGTAPLAVTFTGSASGGVPPYTYSWTLGDGSTSTAQNPPHTFNQAGSFTAVLTVADSAAHTAQAPGVTITVTTAVPPPVVTLIKKASPPFKIVVTGSNLQNGIKVTINGVEWTSVVWKKTTKIQLTGGASLKLAVPKGTTKTFRFLNPDGGETAMTWGW